MPDRPYPERLGPYRLEERLGRGGMGEVFAAWDERLERRVAIKRLYPEKGSRRRLLREARAAAAIDHPSVVQIFDVIEPAGDSDDLWVVMAFFEGRTLAERLEQQGRLPIAACRALARDIAAGLGAAHARGVVHRDLKSENVMLLPDGRAKIVDFGIAKVLQPMDATLDRARAWTTEARVVGTTRAMSPEQALGRDVDARSDLFSLGVLLYEALTGRSPFWTESPNETLVRVCSHAPTPVEEIRPEIPRQLAELVKRLLEKDPSCRPASAAAVIAALESSEASAFSQETLLPAGEDAGSEVSESEVAVAEDAAESEPSGHRRSRGSQGRQGSTSLATFASSLRDVGIPALVAFVLLLVVAMVAVSFWRGSTAPNAEISPVAAPSLRVAIEPTGAGEAQAMLASIVEVALQRALLERDGLVVVTAERDGPLAEDPRRAVELLGADQLLRSKVRCREQACRASLTRWRGDGTLASSVEVPVAAWEPALVQETLDLAVDELFPGHPHGEAGSRQVSARLDAAALEDFFRLRRAYTSGEWTGREPELVERLATLRQRAPRLIEAYVFEADVLRAPPLGDAEALARAGSVLDAATTLAPRDPRPALAAVRVELAAGELEVAERRLDALDRTQPGHPALLRYRAELAAERGDVARAVDLQRRAVSSQPTPTNLYRLATLEHRAGLVEAARATLDRLLEQWPDDLSGLWLRAQLELLHGEPGRAAELYAELRQRRPHAVVSANLGVSLLLAGRPGDALEHLEAALAERPTSASIQLNIADALALLGREAEAEAAYRRVLALLEETAGDETARDETARDGTGPGRSGQGEAWQRLSIAAQAHAHLGEKVRAAESIGRALALAPDSPQVAYEAALVYTLLGESSSAEAHRERAASLGISPAWFESPLFTGRQ